MDLAAVSPSPLSMQQDDAPPTGRSIASIGEMQRHLELMHDRCIARNLRAAGLGAFDESSEGQMYGFLDANARLASGESMLMAVLSNIVDPDKQARFVTILVVDEADVNEHDSNGRTPLMHACISGYDKTAKALLNSKSCDLSLTDNKGNTALHYAAGAGQENVLRGCVKALKSQLKCKSASKENALSMRVEDVVDLRNTDGMTARQLALDAGHDECGALLTAERIRRTAALQKSLSMIQHNTPTLGASSRTGRRVLKRLVSFDSLNLDADGDSSGDELLIRRDSAAAFARPVRRADVKYDNEALIDDEHADSTGRVDSAASIKQPLRAHRKLIRSATVTGPHSRRLPAHALPNLPLNGTDRRPRLGERIRKLLHRKPYSAMRASLDNLVTAADGDTTTTTPPPRMRRRCSSASGVDAALKPPALPPMLREVDASLSVESFSLAFNEQTVRPAAKPFNLPPIRGSKSKVDKRFPLFRDLYSTDEFEPHSLP